MAIARRDGIGPARYLLDLKLQGIEQTGGDNDGRAVMIIVADRDLQLFDQQSLDLVCGGGNVLPDTCPISGVSM